MKKEKLIKWNASYWEVKQEPEKAKENKEMIINRLEDLLDCVKKQSASKINKNFSEIDYYLVGLGMAYNSTIKNDKKIAFKYEDVLL